MQFFLISFLSSIVGAICGIGGGVIIKPVMDLLKLADLSTINFLSCCTVLSMSSYSVFNNLKSGEKKVDMKIGTPLALGAILGGIAGKSLFQMIRSSFENASVAGAVQSGCLAIVTLGTLIYTINKSKIRTYKIENKLFCLIIGLALGCMSSFLGIGGGPINLVVLYFFFSMDTKTAAANSLYCILFSQLSSLIGTLTSGSVPEFQWIALILMAAGGIGGGIVGRKFNQKMDNSAVDKLFIGLIVVIIGISIYNMINYLGAM